MFILRGTLPTAALERAGSKACLIEHGHPPHLISPSQPDSAACRGRPSIGKEWPDSVELGSKDADPSDEQLIKLATAGKSVSYTRKLGGGRSQFTVVMATL